MMPPWRAAALMPVSNGRLPSYRLISKTADGYPRHKNQPRNNASPALEPNSPNGAARLPANIVAKKGR
jgi:hypothetical protein